MVTPTMTTLRPSRVLLIVAVFLAWWCSSVRAQGENEAVSNALTAVDIIRLGDPDNDMIIGEAASDYPTYAEVPNTSFSCQQQGLPGYYADVEAQCQVFHICVTQGRRLEQFSFLCPNGTIFNQQYLVCVWWYDFDCAQASALYNVNEAIFGESPLPLANNGLENDIRGTAAASAPRGQPATSRFPGATQGSGLSAVGDRDRAATGLPTSARGTTSTGGVPLPGLGQRAGGGLPTSPVQGQNNVERLPSSAGITGGIPSQLSEQGTQGLGIPGAPGTTNGFRGQGRPDTPVSGGETPGRFPFRGSVQGSSSPSLGVGTLPSGSFSGSTDDASVPALTRPAGQGLPSTQGVRPDTVRGVPSPSRGSNIQGVISSSGRPGVTGPISGSAISGGLPGSSKPVTSGIFSGSQTRPGTANDVTTTAGRPGTFVSSAGRPGGKPNIADTPRGITDSGSGFGVSQETAAPFSRPGTAGVSGSTGFGTTGGLTRPGSALFTTGGIVGSPGTPAETGGLNGFPGEQGSGLGTPSGIAGPFKRPSTFGESPSLGTQPGTVGSFTTQDGRPGVSGGSVGRPSTVGGFTSQDGRPGTTGGVGRPSAAGVVTLQDGRPGTAGGSVGRPSAVGGVILQGGRPGTTGGSVGRPSAVGGVSLQDGRPGTTGGSVGRPSAVGGVTLQDGRPGTSGGSVGRPSAVGGATLQGGRPGTTGGSVGRPSAVGGVSLQDGRPGTTGGSIGRPSAVGGVTLQDGRPGTTGGSVGRPSAVGGVTLQDGRPGTTGGSVGRPSTVGRESFGSGGRPAISGGITNAQGTLGVTGDNTYSGVRPDAAGGFADSFGSSVGRPGTSGLFISSTDRPIQSESGGDSSSRPSLSGGIRDSTGKPGTSGALTGSSGRPVVSGVITSSSGTLGGFTDSSDRPSLGGGISTAVNNFGSTGGSVSQKEKPSTSLFPSADGRPDTTRRFPSSSGGLTEVGRITDSSGNVYESPRKPSGTPVDGVRPITINTADTSRGVSDSGSESGVSGETSTSFGRPGTTGASGSILAKPVTSGVISDFPSGYTAGSRLPTSGGVLLTNGETILSSREPGTGSSTGVPTGSSGAIGNEQGIDASPITSNQLNLGGTTGDAGQEIILIGDGGSLTSPQSSGQGGSDISSGVQGTYQVPSDGQSPLERFPASVVGSNVGIVSQQGIDRQRVVSPNTVGQFGQGFIGSNVETGTQQGTDGQRVVSPNTVGQFGQGFIGSDVGTGTQQGTDGQRVVSSNTVGQFGQGFTGSDVGTGSQQDTDGQRVVSPNTVGQFGQGFTGSDIGTGSQQDADGQRVVSPNTVGQFGQGFTGSDVGTGSQQGADGQRLVTPNAVGQFGQGFIGSNVGIGSQQGTDGQRLVTPNAVGQFGQGFIGSNIETGSQQGADGQRLVTPNAVGQFGQGFIGSNIKTGSQQGADGQRIVTSNTVGPFGQGFIGSNVGTGSQQGTDGQRIVSSDTAGQFNQGIIGQGGIGTGTVSEPQNQGQFIIQQGQTGPQYDQQQDGPSQGQLNVIQGSDVRPGQGSLGVIQNQGGISQGQNNLQQTYTGQLQGQSGFSQDSPQRLSDSGQGLNVLGQNIPQTGSGVDQSSLTLSKDDGIQSQNILDTGIPRPQIQTQGNKGYNYPVPENSLVLGLGVTSEPLQQSVDQENSILLTQNQESQAPLQTYNQASAFQKTGNVPSSNTNFLDTQGVLTQPIQSTQTSGVSVSDTNNNNNQIFVIKDETSPSNNALSNQNQFINNIPSGNTLSADGQLSQGYTYSNPVAGNVPVSNSFSQNTNTFPNQQLNILPPNQQGGTTGPTVSLNPSRDNNVQVVSSSGTFSAVNQNTNQETNQLQFESTSDILNSPPSSTVLNSADVTQQYSLPSREFSPSRPVSQNNNPGLAQKPQEVFIISNSQSTSPVSLTGSLKQEVIAPVTQAKPTFIFRAPQNSVSTIDLAVLQQGYLPPVNDVSQNTGSSALSISGLSLPGISLPSPTSSTSAMALTSQGTSVSSESNGYVTSNQSPSSGSGSFTFPSNSQSPSSPGTTNPSSSSGFSLAVSTATQGSSTSSQVSSSAQALATDSTGSNSNPNGNSQQTSSPALTLGYLPPVSDFKRNTRQTGREERKIYVTPLPEKKNSKSTVNERVTGRRAFRPSLQLSNRKNSFESSQSPSKRFGQIFFPSSRRSDGFPITYVDNTRRSFVATSSSPFNPYNEYSLSFRS